MLGVALSIVWQGRAGQGGGGAGQGRAGQGRAGQGGAGRGRAGWGRANRAGQASNHLVINCALLNDFRRHIHIYVSVLPPWSMTCG